MIVKGLNSTTREPLNYYPNGTFIVSWEKNSIWQLQLTAINDNSLAYAMLESEASLFWKNQEFIIKQCEASYQDGKASKQIVATHVYSEIQRIRQSSVKPGTLTYTVEDVLSFGLSNNELGFTWKVVGNFASQQITDLGNCSGKDIISKIIETWPEAVVFPDNKQVIVYHQDNFVSNDARRIDYLNNANEIKLSYDSTGIINKARVFGKEKNDTETTTYYFDPFVVENTNSISRYGVHWGEDISDERFTDADSMRAYALSRLIPEPALTIEVSLMTNEEPIPGDIRRLEVREDGYVTEVEVVSYQYYPLDSNQVTQVTLNNRARTILNYQDSIQANILKTIKQQKNKIEVLQSQSQRAAKKFSDFKSQYEGTITKLQEKINELSIETLHVGKIIDVSEFQGTITWPSVIADDVSLSIIRIQDGSSHEDLKYKSNLSGCIAAGGKYAVYAMFRATSLADAKMEANDFYNRTQQVVVDKQQPVFYAIDVENTEMGGDISQMRAGVEAYMDQLNALGVPDSQIVLYIANQLYNKLNLNVSRAGAIWISSYGQNDGTIANSSKPAYNHDLWQYTSKGTINGITGNVDLSAGASNRFKRFLINR